MNYVQNTYVYIYTNTYSHIYIYIDRHIYTYIHICNVDIGLLTYLLLDFYDGEFDLLVRSFFRRSSTPSGFAHVRLCIAQWWCPFD